MKHADKKGLSVLIALVCVSLLTISCAKTGIKTSNEEKLTPVEHQEVPDATLDDFHDPLKCRVYYENWKEAEYELEEAYKKADELYYECD